MSLGGSMFPAPNSHTLMVVILIRGMGVGYLGLMSLHNFKTNNFKIHGLLSSYVPFLPWFKL
jgi:hypothetical protein